MCENAQNKGQADQHRPQYEGGVAMTNHIIRVHRPTLTEEERVRRMDQIKKAAMQLLVADEKRRKSICNPSIWGKTSDSQ